MLSLTFTATSFSWLPTPPWSRAAASPPAHGRASVASSVATDQKGAAAAEAAGLAEGTWLSDEVGGARRLRVAVAGKELTFETGRMARQAMGSVIVKCGDTHVYSACCFEKLEELQPIDFTPLRVDYFERSSAAGLTKGGYIKRDGRPSEHETLVSRLIDRPIRPMIPEAWSLETQITSYVLAYDGANLPDVMAMCAAGASLALSGVPCPKPVAAVRVALLEEAEEAEGAVVLEEEMMEEMMEEEMMEEEMMEEEMMEDAPVPLPGVGDEPTEPAANMVRRFVINPTKQELKKSKLNLVLAGTATDVLMIEGFCDFLPEEVLLEGLEVGLKAVSTIASAITDWQKTAAMPEYTRGLRALPEELDEQVKLICSDQVLMEAMMGDDKPSREDNGLYALQREVLKQLTADKEDGTPGATRADVKRAFKKAASGAMRRMVEASGRRQDGRATTDVRPIDILMKPLPGQVHGSVLFTRGETQALATATLGDSSMAQRYEDLEGEGSKRFYLQYVFPPFSVGEIGRNGAPGRREVGHGNLAERALLPAVPSEEEFPYCLRIESLITESCGSSSMASVCGGCLAMMAAGVPIVRPVAGVAMGLLLDEEGGGGQPIVLTDILGSEDALGTMDFKVAGDTEGVTAFQLDIKCEGLSLPLMRRALDQAKEGRLHILGLMAEAMPTHAATLPDSLPRTVKVTVSPEVVGRIIGKGGETINGIIADTGVTNIAIDKSGSVSISGRTSESIELAQRRIEEIVSSERGGAPTKAPPSPPVALDQEFKGVEVKNIVPFGVFVELYPGLDGFCHISELSSTYVRKMEDVEIAVGDTIDVKVSQINAAKGQYRVIPTTALTVKQVPGGEGRGRGREGGRGRGRGRGAKLPREGASEAEKGLPS